MMRLRWASVIAALILFASVATANSECAWVLWGELYTRESEPVQLTRYFVYPTYDACWAKITELTTVQRQGSWADTLQRWWGTGQYGSRTNASLFGDKVVIVKGERSAHWTCLPDTVDPRWPKTK